MSKRQKQGRHGITRGQTFFPGLSGLKRKLDSVSAPITDRGLTGAAARGPEDVQERLGKRDAKMARRAEAARKAGLLQ